MNLNTVFQDIIALEKENYDKMCGSFSSAYDGTSTKKRLVEEHRDEKCIIYYYSSNMLVAFLRFIIIDRKLKIISLQIRKDYQYYLLKIIRAMYEKFKYLDFDIVETEVYKDNSSSLVLHIKLGLHYSKSVGSKLRFITQKAEFMKALKKYVK